MERHCRNDIGWENTGGFRSGASNIPHSCMMHSIMMNQDEGLLKRSSSATTILSRRSLLSNRTSALLSRMLTTCISNSPRTCYTVSVVARPQISGTFN